MNIKAIVPKKRNALLAVLGISLCASVYYFGVYNSISEVSFQGDYITFDTVSEADQNADLIVIGSTNQNFEQRKHFETFYPDGTPQDFYTLSDLKIHKVLKGPSDIKKGDSVILSELATINQTATGKQLIKDSEYTPLEKNKKYILFLLKNDSGQYCIMNNDLGKFDIDLKEKVLKKDKKPHRTVEASELQTVGINNMDSYDTEFAREVYEKYPIE